MIGVIASLPLPVAPPSAPASRLGLEPLADRTRERGDESWFFAWSAGGGNVMRLSAQLHHDAGPYERGSRSYSPQRSLAAEARRVECRP